MKQKLSELITSELDKTGIENIVFNENVIVEKGHHLELYGNPNGVHSENEDEQSDGASFFVYIDQDITFGELLNQFSYLGSVKDDTLTIRLVEPVEVTERMMCKDNPFSELNQLWLRAGMKVINQRRN